MCRRDDVIVLDEEGLACDVEQLRAMIHGMAGVLKRLSSNRMVQEMTDLPMDDIRRMADDYHQVVCRRAGKLNLLVQAIYEDDEMEFTPEEIERLTKELNEEE